MNTEIKKHITDFTAAALATSGAQGINVVPISVVGSGDSDIFLYDFFMNKTRANVQENPKVAFTCWKGFVGIQIKGTVSYETQGDDFDTESAKMKEQFPERTLFGLLRLTPVQVCDVAPGSAGVQIFPVK